MEQEFPEFFKTHLIFIYKLIFKASRSIQNKEASFIVGACMDRELDLDYGLTINCPRPVCYKDAVKEVLMSVSSWSSKPVRPLKFKG